MGFYVWERFVCYCFVQCKENLYYLNANARTFQVKICEFRYIKTFFKIHQSACDVFVLKNCGKFFLNILFYYSNKLKVYVIMCEAPKRTAKI